MLKPCVSCEHRIVPENGITEDQVRVHNAVAERDLQRLRLLIALCVNSGQREQRRLSFQDPVTLISEFGDSASIFLQDRHGRAPVITCTIGGIFLPGIVHGEQARLRNAN